MAFSTIKGYLAALRNLQISYGLPSPFDTPTPKLDQVLRESRLPGESKGEQCGQTSALDILTHFCGLQQPLASSVSCGRVGSHLGKRTVRS